MEKCEYGLTGLGEMPLLEQVHRISHAIAQRYPYRTVRFYIFALKNE